ncbi:MAG: YlxR family protein [Peptococcaceae bacterium]|nr:YlxR family protein [Peptococcaceae bacterium]
MCVGCREMKEKRELIRVVKTPEGDITIDTKGKMNGRGAYICPKEDCLQKAVKTKGLERAFKQQITPEIFVSLKERLAQDE